MENILEVKDLTKEYRDFALKDITFSLQKGYIMGFMGPNGAGKSTTIKLIMNLVKRDGGSNEVFGLDNIREEIAVKERIGFVYDEGHFYEELTVKQMKRIIAPFYRTWDDTAFAAYLKRFNLPAGKKIKELSKGMKMKFSLALALSHQADLIIMDEPTSGLDPVFRNKILDILREFIEDENKGVLFSTHITTDLDKVADYITFINNGKMVLTGSKEDIMEEYAVVRGGKEILNTDSRARLIGIRENSYGFEALTGDVAGVRRLLGERVVLERPTLEDIMLYTVRGSAHV